MFYIFLVLFACFSLINTEEKYTTKYDSINYDEVLKSERLLNNYVRCLMEKGPCTPDGQELKRVLPDALETNCSKCSDRQKEGARKVINFLFEKKPEIWDELSKKYDPEGIYKEKLMKEWQK